MIEGKLKCKCTDGEVTIVFRERIANEDISGYMEYIQNKIGSWHQSRGCHETALEYLKLPITEDKPIGIR